VIKIPILQFVMCNFNLHFFIISLFLIKMSGRVLKTVSKTLKYFTNPLIEGKYPVIPPPQVPSHIEVPEYIINANPVYGRY
jgi:hypothetical protein